jgi:hypothetical protein
MTEPFFDHEKLDVDRLSIELAAASYGIASREKREPNPQGPEQYFQIARGSAWECAAVHDILAALAVLAEDADRHGKSQWKRVVSMWTRWIQRRDSVPPDAIEYEYRDAEYE